MPTNIQMVDLNLKDAPLRLRCTQDELYTLAVNPADPAIEKIRKSLARQFESGKVEALVLPLGLGHHVDHLTVREAAFPEAAHLPTAFYEDLPGAITTLESPDKVAVDASLQISQPLTPVFSASTSNAVQTKRRLALAYPSQIDSAEADLISNFAARYDASERLWANPAWITLAESSQLSISRTQPIPPDSGVQQN